MIQVWREGITQRLVPDQRVGAIHVVHPAVEVVGGVRCSTGQPKRRVVLEAQRAGEQGRVALDVLLLALAAQHLVRLGAAALAPDARRCHLHAGVASRHYMLRLPPIECP